MDRSKQLVVAVALFVLFVACCGGLVGAEETTQPGEPASFYGEAVEANETNIPAGVEIVAVVDGDIEGEITVETPGEYGGSGAFDDKLRVDSTAGDGVTFRLVGPNGSAGGTTALESGISEFNLTFPEGSIESLPPTSSAEVDPTVATSGEPIRFSGAESTAYAGTELVAFEWSIRHDGATIDTFEGERVDRSVDTPGEYTAVLTVSDADGRTATATSAFEVERVEKAGDTTGGGGGGSSDAGGGGSTGGGGGSGGGGGGIGGGGGGAGIVSSDDPVPQDDPEHAETRRIEDQFPNKPGVTVAFDETTISEIVLENRSAAGEISVTEFGEPTPDAPPLPGDWEAASAFVVTVPDAYRETDALIRAVVSDEWLSERGFAPEHLTVYRLPDGGDHWESLPTEAFEIDNGYLVEAETPGFSQFVIAGREPPSSGNDGSGTTNSDPTASETTTSGDSSEPAETESTGATGFDPASPLVPLAALCALLVVVAAIGRLFIPRRRDEW